MDAVFMGFIPVPTTVNQPQDGACLFHSIAWFLNYFYSFNTTGDGVRVTVVNWVRQNRDLYKGILTLDNDAVSIDVYCDADCQWIISFS